MQRLVVIGKDLVAVQSGGSWMFASLDEVTKLVDRRQPLVVGVVPTQTAVLTASEKTLDAALSQRFGTNHSYRTEQLEANRHQAFAISDELFGSLRQLSKTTYVVPYGAAVRQAVAGHTAEGETRIVKLSKALLGGAEEATDAPTDPTQAGDKVVIDVVDSNYLLTLLRGQEVLSVRRLQGGDLSVELQRTIAAHRMENPRVLSTDRDLVVDLSDQGFPASWFEPRGPLVGCHTLEQVVSLRFLNPVEVAQARARRHRRQTVAAVAIPLSLVVLLVAAELIMTGVQLAAERRAAQLSTQRDEHLAALRELYPSRFAASARKQSVAIHEELFELMLALPPQVALVSLDKTGTGIAAVIERRADAAPFSRVDLEAALASSPLFGKAHIREEYSGHAIRYHLTFGEPAGAPENPLAATPPPVEEEP